MSASAGVVTTLALQGDSEYGWISNSPRFIGVSHEQK
jgi:hypothetical protein